jgi:hypothetical protein
MSHRSFHRHVLIVLWAVCVAGAGIGIGQNPVAARIVGQWREFEPGNNLVQFNKDGTLKLYLQKGEIPNTRVLEGNWSLADDGTLILVMNFLGRKLTDRVRASFEGDELVLTKRNGPKERHRRHEGPLPAEFQW